MMPERLAGEIPSFTVDPGRLNVEVPGFTVDPLSSAVEAQRVAALPPNPSVYRQLRSKLSVRHCHWGWGAFPARRASPAMRPTSSMNAILLPSHSSVDGCDSGGDPGEAVPPTASTAHSVRVLNANHQMTCCS